LERGDQQCHCKETNRFPNIAGNPGEIYFETYKIKMNIAKNQESWDRFISRIKTDIFFRIKYGL
jgi:hypothetical protein